MCRKFLVFIILYKENRETNNTQQKKIWNGFFFLLAIRVFAVFGHTVSDLHKYVQGLPGFSSIVLSHSLTVLSRSHISVFSHTHVTRCLGVSVSQCLTNTVAAQRHHTEIYSQQVKLFSSQFMSCTVATIKFSDGYVPPNRMCVEYNFVFLLWQFVCCLSMCSIHYQQAAQMFAWRVCVCVCACVCVSIVFMLMAKITERSPQMYWCGTCTSFGNSCSGTEQKLNVEIKRCATISKTLEMCGCGNRAAI